MKKKITLISLVLIGFVFVFSGSAWAGRDVRHGHHYQKWHHKGAPFYKKHPGWGHGRRGHYGPRYRGKHHRPYRRPVVKHIYHHTSSDNRYNDYDQYQAAGTVSEPGFSFSFGISGTR
jgi:hypothetical protein